VKEGAGGGNRGRRWSEESIILRFWDLGIVESLAVFNTLGVDTCSRLPFCNLPCR